MYRSTASDRVWRSALILGCVVGIVALMVQAGTITLTTSDGKGADTYIQTNKAKSNFGSDPKMVLMFQAAGGRKAYIRFDFSSMAEPIKGATLHVRVVPNTGKDGSEYNVFALNDGDEGENWVEGASGEVADDPKGEKGITSASAPGNAKGGGGKYDAGKKSGGGVDPQRTTFLGTFVVDNTDYRLTKGTDPVAFSSQEMVDFLANKKNKTVTFIITRTGRSDTAIASFGTKEGNAPAKLVLSSDPLPIPVQPPLPVTTAPAGKADAPAKGKGGGKGKQPPASQPAPEPAPAPKAE